MKTVWIISILFPFFYGASSKNMQLHLKLRGGLVPDPVEAGIDFYEQFDLDYGSDDKVRSAGSLRGFLKSGKIKSLPEKDPFLKWLNEHLERGPTAIAGRIKPFYVQNNVY
jgi:hypothetical protein